MVIVDVRSTGGRGETGIPTDAYFAVEEIRDVSLLRLIHAPDESLKADVCRMEPLHNVHSLTCLLLSKQKKQKKSELNIFYETLLLHRAHHPLPFLLPNPFPPALPPNSPPYVVFMPDWPTLASTWIRSELVQCP